MSRLHNIGSRAASVRSHHKKRSTNTTNNINNNCSHFDGNSSEQSNYSSTQSSSRKSSSAASTLTLLSSDEDCDNNFLVNCDNNTDTIRETSLEPVNCTIKIIPVALSENRTEVQELPTEEKNSDQYRGKSKHISLGLHQLPKNQKTLQPPSSGDSSLRRLSAPVTDHKLSVPNQNLQNHTLSAPTSPIRIVHRRSEEICPPNLFPFDNKTFEESLSSFLGENDECNLNSCISPLLRKPKEFSFEREGGPFQSSSKKCKYSRLSNSDCSSSTTSFIFSCPESSSSTPGTSARFRRNSFTPPSSSITISDSPDTFISSTVEQDSYSGSPRGIAAFFEQFFHQVTF